MPKRKSRLGWKDAALANAQSITYCATGYSRVNDTGASPFQLFGKTGSIVHCRKKNCQSLRRRSTITNRPALENRRWQRQKSGSVTPTRRCARQTPCRSGQARAGITCGVEGVARFLARVWRLLMTENQAGEWELSKKIKALDATKPQQKVLHATIKKVTEDIESFSFNTAISQMMILVNAFTNAAAFPLAPMRTFLVLLNPFAPHLTSELWEKLNAKLPDNLGDITEQKWPGYDERFLVEDEVEIVIQVNGKVRDRMKMSIQASEEEIKNAALA